MTRQNLAKCFVLTGITLIICTFISIIGAINSYSNSINDTSSHVIAAFDA